MARSAHPPPSRQETYHGLPMLRASAGLPTTRALLEQRFGSLEFIDKGGYGEVWRTANGRIVKATASRAEAYCVTTILDSHIRSPWLPQIFSAGWFSGAQFTWCSDRSLPEEEREAQEMEHYDRCPAAAEVYEPVFWYERVEVEAFSPLVSEMVTDIYHDGYAAAAKKWTKKKGRKANAWLTAARTARAIRAAMLELPSNTGLFPIDAGPRNWGLTEQGWVVLRDLACGSADEMYDDEDQNAEIDVQEWPPPSLWDGVLVPKEVGGPPAEEAAELRISWPDLFEMFRTESKEAWKQTSEQHRQAREQIGRRLMELLRQKRTLEFTDPLRKVAFVAMLQRDGVIRFGRFDSRGPVGHDEIPPGDKQAMELVEDLGRNLARHPDEHTTTIRILPPERSLVDFWMRQPLGKWGTKALEIIQNSNARRARGDYEGANAYERAEYEKLGAQPPETPIPDTVGGPPYGDIKQRLKLGRKRLPAEKIARTTQSSAESLVEPGYVRFREDMVRLAGMSDQTARRAAQMTRTREFLRPFGVHGNLVSSLVVLEIALSFWPAELDPESHYGPFRVLVWARWRTDPGRHDLPRPTPIYEMGIPQRSDSTKDDFWDWFPENSPMANQVGEVAFRVGEVFFEAWMGDAGGGNYPEGGRLVLNASMEALLRLMQFGDHVFLGPPGNQLGALDRWWLDLHRRLAFREPGQIAEEWWQQPDPDVTSGPREKPYNRKDDRLAVIAQMRVREALPGERTTHSGTLAIRLGPDMTEEWDWTALEGRQVGGKGRIGRIVVDLPGNPAAGLVWADFNGEPKIVAFWTEELLRRHSAMRALIAVYRQHISPRVVVVGPFSTAGKAAAAALADAIEDEPDEGTTGGLPARSYKALKEALELPPDTNLVDLIERLHPHATDPDFQPWTAPAPTQQELAAREAPEPQTWLLGAYRRARIREAIQHLFGDWHGHRQRSDTEPGPGGDPLLWRCVGIGVELALEAAGHLIGACHGRFAAARLDARQQPLQGRALEAREREDLEVFAYVRRTMDLAWDWFQQDNPTQTFWPVVYAAQQNEQLLQQLSEALQPGLVTIRRVCGERTLNLIYGLRDATWNLLTWILGHREQGRAVRPQSPLWQPHEQLPWVLRSLELLALGWAGAFDTLTEDDRRWPWFINEVARRCRSRIAVRLRYSPLAH